MPAGILADYPRELVVRGRYRTAARRLGSAIGAAAFPHCGQEEKQGQPQPVPYFLDCRRHHPCGVFLLFARLSIRGDEKPHHVCLFRLHPAAVPLHAGGGYAQRPDRPHDVHHFRAVAVVRIKSQRTKPFVIRVFTYPFIRFFFVLLHLVVGNMK